MTAKGAFLSGGRFHKQKCAFCLHCTSFVFSFFGMQGKKHGHTEKLLGMGIGHLSSYFPHELLKKSEYNLRSAKHQLDRKNNNVASLSYFYFNDFIFTPNCRLKE